MKKDSVKWCIIFFLTLMLIVGFEIIQRNWRVENAPTVTAECEIVEKYAQNSGPRNAALRYYLVLAFFDGQSKYETTIMTTRQGFDNVAIGDSVLCEVTYDKTGILNISVMDSGVDHYTKDEQGKDLVSALCVVGGIVALLAGVAFLLPKVSSKHKE